MCLTKPTLRGFVWLSLQTMCLRSISHKFPWWTNGKKLWGPKAGKVFYLKNVCCISCVKLDIDFKLNVAKAFRRRTTSLGGCREVIEKKKSSIPASHWFISNLKSFGLEFSFSTPAYTTFDTRPRFCFDCT